ncbi:hypothetical protein DSECCO2_511820 [anaerobic digester metagenome]
MKNLPRFVIILAFMFFTMIDIHSIREWIIVRILKHTEQYPWGPVNDNPWYYASPELYSSVVLTESVLLTILLAFVIRFMIRREKKRTVYALLACFLLSVAMIINGKTQ